MRVMLAGGGTAGHIEPALATAEALRRQDPGVTVRLLGTARGLETRLVPERGWPLDLIEPVPLPRRLSPDLLRLPGRLRSAVTEVKRLLVTHRIDVVAGFGGYVALPAYLAARNGPPIVIHEANAKPGLANRVGSRWAASIATAGPSSLAGSVAIGMPLRRSISGCDRTAGRDAARSKWGLRAGGTVLLVTGGSQGARRINEAVVGSLSRLLDLDVQVLHVTGGLNIDAVRDEVESLGITDPRYHAVAYVEDMAEAYAAADLILCRSGMMTVAEVTTVGLPAIFVPLPIGNGEQRLNAMPVVESGAALLVDDSELTPDWLAVQVSRLIGDPDRLDVMSKAAAGLGRRDADDRLADLIRSAASGGS